MAFPTEISDEKYIIKFAFRIQNVKFDTLEQFIRVVKTSPDTFPWKVVREKYLEMFLSEEIPYLENIYAEAERLFFSEDECPPYTGIEVFKDIQNAEQKWLILSLIDPAEVVKSVDATFIASETIEKKQFKYDVTSRTAHKLNTNFDHSDIVKTEVTYLDTYELWMIDKDLMGTEEDVYYVKCKDASSDKTYYLYIDDSVCDTNPEVLTDPIAAIASTMFKEDNRTFLTKEEYLQIQSEA